MTTMTSRRSGVALITALAILVVVGGIAALMAARTVSEAQHSGDDTGIVQSLLLARGAANLAGAVMEIPIRGHLNTIVNSDSSTVERWSFGSGTGDRPTPVSVAQALSTNANSVARKLQTATDTLLCATPVPGLSGGGAASLRVYFTRNACDTPLPAGVDLPTGRFVEGQPRTGSGAAADQTYALPFVIVAEGTVGPYSRTIVTGGEYQFTVGRGSFAQYALFTSRHTTETGGEIWFTGRTLFDGPVHTNSSFRFYGPGPEQAWFGGADPSPVTSAGCVAPTPTSTTCPSATTPGATFFGSGFQNVAQMAANGGVQTPSYTNGAGTHAPQFTGGVGWNADFVPLPQNTLDQRAAAVAAGVAIPTGRNLSLLELVAAVPDTSSSLPPGERNMRALDLSASPAESASHQVIRACFTQTVSGWFNVQRETADGDWIGTQWRNGATFTVCDEYRYVDTGPNAGRLETRRIWYDAAVGTGETQGVPNARVVVNPGYTDREWTFLHADPTLRFNGVVHVDGSVDRVRGPGRTPAGSTDPDTAPPAVASFAQITVAAEQGVRITGDLKYEDAPCTGVPTRGADGVVVPATCDNLDARNILGIYSQGTGTVPGNVMIGNNNAAVTQRNAPDNVTIHGVLMSSTGIVGVEDFNLGAPRGNVNLLGGVIEYFYGAFGTFDSGTGQNVSGYGRAFAFDRRTRDRGLAPPFFPTIDSDSVRELVIIAYGQREQVE